ncbi:hypothetical protein predicted by Glimmer/Critica (plasmid) [Sinorhizobium fredii HH103]|uniref:Uncharacterized protein n=1 Tax=Sinorhizobium fredii (strain HH103) TaxID=1117943 RepID=G9AHY5_SINF1|nr:hypothetical protein predicted by Glimmer/Critica [Sinorhizobium fredii HH103]
MKKRQLSRKKWEWKYRVDNDLGPDRPKIIR